MAYTAVPAASVAQTDPTAVFGRRVVAAGIDLTIAFGLPVALVARDLTVKSRDEYESEWAPRNGNIPFEDYCHQYTEASSGVCSQAGDVLIFGPEQGGGPQLLAIVVLFALGVLLQGLTGWTVGKLIMGLRTVRADGQVCGIPKAAGRWALWIVDGQPCGIPLVGFITGLTTQGHRRVGDMAAKTFVVRKQAMGAPIVVPGMTAPPPPGAMYAPPVGAAPWAPSVAPADPSDPPGWAAPPPPQWSPPPPVAPAPPPPGVEAPHWDDARNAYIQWDPDLQAWMQWDDPGQRWFKITGQ